MQTSHWPILTYFHSLTLTFAPLQVLEAELTSHEIVIHGVSEMAQELITSGHFASGKIQERNEELQDVWLSLKSLASQRSQMINDSLEGQQVRRGGEGREGEERRGGGGGSTLVGLTIHLYNCYRHVPVCVG